MREAYGTTDLAPPLIPFGLVLDIPLLLHPLMEKPFDPSLFVAMMRQGAFDGRLHEELANLTREQLEQLVLLLPEQTGHASLKTLRFPAPRNTPTSRLIS
jgi:hypothetical protein